MEIKFTKEFFRENFKNEECEYLKDNKVFNWLNLDNISDIIADDTSKTFYIELVGGYSTLPKYFLQFIKRWMKKRGYAYQYDVYN